MANPEEPKILLACAPGAEVQASELGRVSDGVRQSVHAARQVFHTDEEARNYLQRNVPALEATHEDVDRALLQRNLFEHAEQPSSGHYEFEENGMKISYDLVQTDGDFDRCYASLRGTEDHMAGSYKPIFAVRNLHIEAEGFSFDMNELEPRVGITWMPALKSTKIENTAFLAYTSGSRRDLYLFGEDGWLARPRDILALFHELGHSETRSSEDRQAESASITRKITAKGWVGEPIKESALELQRERDANEWMLHRIGGLLKAIGLPDEVVKAHIKSQMESYYRKRRTLLEA